MKVFIPTEGFKNYVAALTALGAEVRFADPESCDGLLLPGGWDVDPALYGQENRGSQGIDRALDRRETEAVRLFTALGRPILGICRGVQVINVAFGGTLHQDIPGHDRIGEKDRIHGSCTVDRELIGLYGQRFPVNSSHHQAVDLPGEGLRPVQWAEDGTVEALRHDTLPVFGVQWHPERLRSPTDGWKLLARWLETLSGK